MRFPHNAVARFLTYFLGLFEVLLATRVVLKILGASTQAAIVDFIYQLTGAIIAPFVGIFSNVRFGDKGVIDLVAISAMIGYPVVVYILVELLSLASRDAAREGR